MYSTRTLQKLKPTQIKYKSENGYKTTYIKEKYSPERSLLRKKKEKKKEQKNKRDVLTKEEFADQEKKKRKKEKRTKEQKREVLTKEEFAEPGRKFSRNSGRELLFFRRLL